MKNSLCRIALVSIALTTFHIHGVSYYEMVQQAINARNYDSALNILAKRITRQENRAALLEALLNSQPQLTQQQRDLVCTIKNNLSDDLQVRLETGAFANYQAFSGIQLPCIRFAARAPQPAPIAHVAPPAPVQQHLAQAEDDLERALRLSRQEAEMEARERQQVELAIRRSLQDVQQVEQAVPPAPQVPAKVAQKQAPYGAYIAGALAGLAGAGLVIGLAGQQAPAQVPAKVAPPAKVPAPKPAVKPVAPAPAVPVKPAVPAQPQPPVKRPAPAPQPPAKVVPPAPQPPVKQAPAAPLIQPQFEEIPAAGRQVAVAIPAQQPIRVAVEEVQPVIGQPQVAHRVPALQAARTQELIGTANQFENVVKNFSNVIATMPEAPAPRLITHAAPPSGHVKLEVRKKGSRGQARYEEEKVSRPLRPTKFMPVHEEEIVPVSQQAQIIPGAQPLTAKYVEAPQEKISLQEALNDLGLLEESKNILQQHPHLIDDANVQYDLNYIKTQVDRWSRNGAVIGFNKYLVRLKLPMPQPEGAHPHVAQHVEEKKLITKISEIQKDIALLRQRVRAALSAEKTEAQQPEAQKPPVKVVSPAKQAPAQVEKKPEKEEAPTSLDSSVEQTIESFEVVPKAPQKPKNIDLNLQRAHTNVFGTEERNLLVYNLPLEAVREWHTYITAIETYIRSINDEALNGYLENLANADRELFTTLHHVFERYISPALRINPGQGIENRKNINSTSMNFKKLQKKIDKIRAAFIKLSLQFAEVKRIGNQLELLHKSLIEQKKKYEIKKEEAEGILNSWFRRAYKKTTINNARQKLEEANTHLPKINDQIEGSELLWRLASYLEASINKAVNDEKRLEDKIEEATEMKHREQAAEMLKELQLD